MHPQDRNQARKLVNWPPRVQVAGVSSLAEALFCGTVGVDALGFTLELPSGIHDGLSRERAAAIVRDLPEGLLPVVITYLQSGSAACELAREVAAAAVQFHGGISLEEINLFRKLCPEVMTIGRVTVSGEGARAQAQQFSPPLWDALILDSADPASNRIGATGLTHDWAVSAAIVRDARVPVILAGGLTPGNVAEAIRRVNPDGVDAHTGLEEPDGRRSFAKIKAFALAALTAYRVHPHPRFLP